jgi:hypothetical protein
MSPARPEKFNLHGNPHLQLHLGEPMQGAPYLSLPATPQQQSSISAALFRARIGFAVTIVLDDLCFSILHGFRTNDSA